MKCVEQNLKSIERQIAYAEKARNPQLGNRCNAASPRNENPHNENTLSANQCNAPRRNATNRSVLNRNAPHRNAQWSQGCPRRAIQRPERRRGPKRAHRNLAA